MSLIRFITKIFTDHDKLDESTVEVVVELPTRTKQELFDDAVKKVVADELTTAVLISLREACYLPEVVEQTKLATEEYGCDYLTSEQLEDIHTRYPKALTRHQNGRRYITGIIFDEYLLAKLLVNSALSKEGNDEA